MSTFWSVYVAVLTIANVLACGWLIRWTQRPQPGESAKGEVMDHVWDDDLCEFNNPLPRWWLWLFYITIFFALGYLALYPGLGRFSGLLGWSQELQYEEELARADARYAPVFDRFAQQDLAQLSRDPQARAVGERLFLNYCSTCHGSDARGAPGFPNLADDDWLYGGKPETILATILDGRNGIMPGWREVLGDTGVDEVVAFVLSRSARQVDAAKAEAGARHFALYCAGCHGADARGNPALGAPDLTDGAWLYGGSEAVLQRTIAGGRQGHMPAHRDFLGEPKARLLAAYIYSLSAPYRAQ